MIWSICCLVLAIINVLWGYAFVRWSNDYDMLHKSLMESSFFLALALLMMEK